MSLEAIYFASQIVAAAAIVGSLIFVGLQMRAQSRETRIAATDRLLEEYRNFVLTAAINESVAEIFQKGVMGGFAALRTDTERMQLASIFNTGFRIVEQAYRYRTADRLDDDAWRSILGALSPTVLSSGGQEFWASRRYMFSDAFIEFVDQQIASERLPRNYETLFRSPSAKKPPRKRA